MTVEEPDFYQPFSFFILALFYSLFLAPSIVYLFAYVVIYVAIIGLIYIPLLKGETFHDHRGRIITWSLGAVCLCIGIFYILQRRELKRFFEKEEAVKKEK